MGRSQVTLRVFVCGPVHRGAWHDTADSGGGGEGKCTRRWLLVTTPEDTTRRLAPRALRMTIFSPILC